MKLNNCNMDPKSKARYLVKTFGKEYALKFCDEILSINLGQTNGDIPIEGNSLCADDVYWYNVRAYIDSMVLSLF